MVRFTITFPAHYPNGAAPSFVLDKGSTIDITTQQELLKVGVALCFDHTH